MRLELAPARLRCHTVKQSVATASVELPASLVDARTTDVDKIGPRHAAIMLPRLADTMAGAVVGRAAPRRLAVGEPDHPLPPAAAAARRPPEALIRVTILLRSRMRGVGVVPPLVLVAVGDVVPIPCADTRGSADVRRPSRRGPIATTTPTRTHPASPT
jgi:hypothetical protein